MKIRTVDGGMSCVDCHPFEEGEVLSAPNLYKYMSRQWMIDFISNPAAAGMKAAASANAAASRSKPAWSCFSCRT